MVKNQSIQEFLDQLASSAPTPGGGGAAALLGATGAALTSMVCNLTIGKEKYKDVEEEMKNTLGEAEDLRARLTDMIAADVEVFDKLMGSYGLPKETDDEKAARSEAIQVALREATDVPLECARACADVIAVSRSAAEKGNTNVISDAGVSVMAAYGALKSAALNVYINAGSIKDKDFADKRLADLEKLLANAEKDTNEIYQIVKGKL
ncbi:MAG: methenyltetrahydrofolate cyclohydrolase [Gammaproteobacteria bacterium]